MRLRASSLLLNVLGEGTFLDLLRFIEVHAPDAATAAAETRAAKLVSLSGLSPILVEALTIMAARSIQPADYPTPPRTSAC